MSTSQVSQRITSPYSRAATFTPSSKILCSFDDHVGEINADAELDPHVLWHLGLAVGHPALHLHSAPHGIDHARELGEEAVGSVLYDPASVLCLGLTSPPK